MSKTWFAWIQEKKSWKKVEIFRSVVYNNQILENMLCFGNVSSFFVYFLLHCKIQVISSVSRAVFVEYSVPTLMLGIRLAVSSRPVLSF